MICALKHSLESYWLILVIVAVSACQQEVDKPVDTGVNKFSDPVLVQVYEYQDQRDTESLLGFFNDESPKYREEAALAFASVQDTSAIRPLALLLNDGSARVRRAAAYALGQMYDRQCIDPLVRALQTEDSVFARKELIEALGKVITMETIDLLHQVAIGSEKEKEGLAWALYRAGIRNVHDGITLDIALSLLDTANSYETRLGAAHFFARSPNLALAGREGLLIRVATSDPSPAVRMAATKALGTVVTQKSAKALTMAILKDTDPGVRVNCAKAMENFPMDQVQPALTTLLQDDNINVRIAAAQVLASKPAKLSWEQVNGITGWGVKSILLGGLLKYASTKDEFTRAIQGEYETADNPYYKAGLLNALGNVPVAKDFIFKEILAPPHPVIGTAGTKALISIRQHKDFPENWTKDFANKFKQIIETGDVGSIALVSQMYLRPGLKFSEQYDDYKFLESAKNTLTLPRDNEALQVLNAAIALFKGLERPVTKNEYNHPIDWEQVKQIPKRQKVTIETAKGNVTLRLLVEDAPATVSNFLSLVDTGYFNGKNFHRVVPNFVVQGGCHRGDGYGSEDYSIRSEFANLRYQQGSVGMASAGKDTEGTQWFITHSPTPHLDGRYTIFAQVEEGMEVIDQLEVGDEIIQIKVMDNGVL